MKINSIHLTTVNKISDYVPGISTVTSLSRLFIKYVILPKQDESKILDNHFYKHVHYQSFNRLIVLLVPIIGNISVSLYDIITRERTNKTFLLSALNKKNAYVGVPSVLRKASKELQDDIEVVKTAVSQDAAALESASPRLRNSVEVGLVAAQSKMNKHAVLELGGPNCKDHETIALYAVNYNGSSLKHASLRVRGLFLVVLTAVRRDSRALEFASEDLKKNPRIQEAYRKALEFEQWRDNLLNHGPGCHRIFQANNPALSKCVEDLRCYKKEHSDVFNTPQELSNLVNRILEGDGSPRAIMGFSKEDVLTSSKIKKIFHKLVRCHPDRNSSYKELAELVFCCVVEARESLLKTIVN